MVYKSSCRGCHGGCMFLLTVEDGKLIKAVPDPDGPLNNGNACAKGRTIIEQMYHPDRIVHPMKRIGERESGKWERISWDEAFDTIACKLQQITEEYGAEAIATITGTGRHHLGYLARFMQVLGSPNACSAGALICLGPRLKGGLHTGGIFCNVDYYGEKKPEGIIAWGSNPIVSGPDGELQWHLKDAIKNNTQFLVIDPYPTELAKHAKIWLRIRPGTDGALALCFLNIIISEGLYDKEFVENWTYGFEELKDRCSEYDVDSVSKITSIPKEDILKAARWIANTKPLGLEWGNAFEQSVNAFQTARAIFMIPAITGNYDVPGGFCESKEIAPAISATPEHIIKPNDIGPMRVSPRMSRFDPPFPHPWSILESMRTKKPYKIRALMSFANNALLSVPDARHTYECLKEIDFFVYMDFFMNPTAQMADIFLPAGLWPEVNGVYCMPEFGDHSALCMQKVVQVGECMSDEDFFIELTKRMGLDYGVISQTEIIDEILGEMAKRYPEYEGINFDKFKEIGSVTPKREYYKYKKRGGFNTPTGKFELYSVSAKEDGADPLPYWKEPPESPVSDKETAMEYPLIFTSGKRQQQYFISNNRQIKSLRKTAEFPMVSLNPKTAQKYGIKEGEWAYIESPRGKITQKVELVSQLDENVVHCQFGWWYPESEDPLFDAFLSNANVLTQLSPPHDEFGAYQMRGLLCKVYPNPDGKEIEKRFYNSRYFDKLEADESKDTIVFDIQKCILCGECVKICPKKALEIASDEKKTVLRARNAKDMASSSCVACMQCVKVCPVEAIRKKI